MDADSLDAGRVLLVLCFRVKYTNAKASKQGSISSAINDSKRGKIEYKDKSKWRRQRTVQSTAESREFALQGRQALLSASDKCFSHGPSQNRNGTSSFTITLIFELISLTGKYIFYLRFEFNPIKITYPNLQA